MKPQKLWTTGELSRLKAMVAEHRTTAEIAAALGRTVDSVNKTASRHGYVSGPRGAATAIRLRARKAAKQAEAPSERLVRQLEEDFTRIGEPA